MAEKHELIRKKLRQYPEDVQTLATRALELAETMPESSVAEELKGVVRRVIKDKEGSQ
jgi:hypothetical protein